MADRRKSRITTATVLRTERVTPRMTRVVLGGDALRGLDCGQFTDHYIKIQFPVPGVAYPEPFDLDVIRETMPADQWPVSRTYTVRRWRPEIPEMWIDVVTHGDTGIAGPWALRVQPGEPVRFRGPGGAYAPDAEADWHLLIGDESALPAIAAALEAMPEGTSVKAYIEVADERERQILDTRAKAEITWLDRGAAPVGRNLVDAVRTCEFEGGLVQVFAHGEANMVRELRRFLRVERGLPMSRLSISGYWRLGMNEDGWQSSKRDWNRRVETEETAATDD